MSLKSLIVDHLKSKVQEELDAAIEASESVSSYKNSDDMKPEGKYDTRATEAGYLAGAQAKRVEELKQEIELLEKIPLRDFAQDEPIALGALVELKLNERVQRYFISSTAGGTMLNISDTSLLVISVFSPLGAEMLDYKAGDEFEVETPQGLREYAVVSVC